MDVCSNFTPGAWRPNECRSCFHQKEEHLANQTTTSSIETPLSSDTRSPRPSSPSTTPKINDLRSVFQHNTTPLVDTVKSNQSSIAENMFIQQQEQQFVTDFNNIISVTPSNEPNSSTKQIPCRYGTKCYRKNPLHLEKYSHLPEPEDVLQKHVKLVEERFLASMADLVNKNRSLEEAIKKLDEEKMLMATYHQQLENALKQELNNRKRREIEKQRILEIRRDTPSYWGINAFDEPYRQIDIRSQSPEFNILCGLLNDTIGTHGNNYGTIYEKDPTEFIVIQITRIHNKALWHEYCYKKESITEKNNKRLVDCESSKYLKDYPLLTPLLDTNANEYWLFHGCDEGIIPVLLHNGYDPRVSTLNGMFGGGFYLAENSSKSNQYIPCPGCGKNAISRGSGCSCRNQENLEFAIILYRVVLGDVHIAKQYDEKTYRGAKLKKVRRPPCKKNSLNLHDSIMGESVKHGGNKLQYREFILYETGQAYPEYVIKFKRSAVNARTPSDINSMKNKCYYFLKNTFSKKHE